MKIVFPMAGSGQRFLKAGYTQHKPLIPINGRPMIAHVLDMFRPSDSFVFVCDRDHLVEGMYDELLKLAPKAVVVGIAPHTRGPCFTTVSAYDHIKDDEPVIICYCDGTMHWNRTAFLEQVQQNKLDGMLYTNTGFHPHTLSTTKLAFLKEKDGLLTEIKEKSSYTNDPLSEHSSSGVYFFSRGAHVKHYFNRLMNEGLHHNGEYYVTLVYNLMVQDGLRIGYYDCEDTAILGTPEEVRNFEAWATILEGHQVRSEEDALRCYRYWKRYHLNEARLHSNNPAGPATA